MNLYEIQQGMEDCIDAETGEIIDIEKLENLFSERNSKIENIGLWYKNLCSDVEQLKSEIKVLSERKKSAESKIAQLKNYIDTILSGEKFETPKLKISYRKSKSLCCDDNFINWAMNNADNFLRYKEPEIDKNAVTDAIKNGDKIEHAYIIEKNNISIK